MRFHAGYAAVAVALFLIEVVIALFVHDRFVRPYMGDVFAVILVYAAFRAMFRIEAIPATAIAFAIAVIVEFGQFFHVLDLLGLADNQIARTVLGTGFEREDFVAYGAGALIVLGVEHLRARRRSLKDRRSPSAPSHVRS